MTHKKMPGWEENELHLDRLRKLRRIERREKEKARAMAKFWKTWQRRITLVKLQEEVGEWAAQNFGDDAPWEDAFMGCVEELGELSHALLKQKQGIRGSTEEHEAAGQDAVGDLIIYLCDLCRRRGWSLSECVGKAWSEVSERDWKKNPETGTAKKSRPHAAHT